VDPLFGVRGPADAQPEVADAMETSRRPRG